MTFDFETYGPFILGSVSPKTPIQADVIEQLWPRVQDEHPGLEAAVGIYIFAVKKNRKSDPVPWYVGKTDQAFGKRLRKRLKLFQNISQKVGSGELVLFLLARLTPTKRFMRPRSAAKGRQSIEKLETMLIGSCASKNSELLNLKKMAHYRGLRVPGYMGDKGEVQSKSALHLRKMLKEK